MNAVDCYSPLNATKAKVLKSSSIDAVGRYLNNLTQSEVSAIHGAGLDLFALYETNPTDSLYFTYAQGVRDASAAVKRAQTLSQPAGTAIIFPVDYDAQPADFSRLQAYYRGARSQIGGYLLGGYGSYQVIEYLASQKLCDVYMQTVAWSFGAVSSHARIYQRECDTTLHGISVDLDDIRQAVGLWTVGNADVNPPSPTNKQRQVNTLNVTPGKVVINNQPADTLVMNNTNYVPWTVLESLPGFSKTMVGGVWHFSFGTPNIEEAKKFIQQAQDLL
jgi:hypothetical protein